MTARRFGLSIAAALFVADQILKAVIISPLALPHVGKIDLLPFFDLTWVENRGIAMGLAQATSEPMRWGLTALTAGIAAFVAHWLWRESNRTEVIGLGLILGGAAGNIVDRVRLGYVADFLDFHIGEFRPFLIFNLADAAITIGVLILLARAFFAREKSDTVENDNA